MELNLHLQPALIYATQLYRLACYFKMPLSWTCNSMLWRQQSHFCCWGRLLECSVSNIGFHVKLNIHVGQWWVLSQGPQLENEIKVSHYRRKSPQCAFLSAQILHAEQAELFEVQFHTNTSLLNFTSNPQLIVLVWVGDQQCGQWAKTPACKLRVWFLWWWV